MSLLKLMHKREFGIDIRRRWLSSVWTHRIKSSARRWMPLKPIAHFNRRGQMMIVYRMLPRREPKRFRPARWKRIGRPPFSTNWSGRI